MRASPSPMSVADYCSDYNAGRIVVNQDYQRNVGLWTSQARSYFIESILLQFPIPKIYLHAKLDLKSRQTIKEVVDGQQRTQALTMFFNGKQRLTKNIDTEELRGLTYKQLNEEWQERFLTYSLPIDQFSSAQDGEIREAFRRMNANNIPLNDEEQRNAKFQGPFKWYLVNLADKYEQSLFHLGIFSKRDMVRMADLKTYSEILDVIDSGFHTIKGKQIDELYRRYNSEFPKEAEFTSALLPALDKFLQRTDLHRDQFLKPFIFQSIVIALIFPDQSAPLGSIGEDEKAAILKQIETASASTDTLADALSDRDMYPNLKSFVDACTTKTNVDVSRHTRYAFFSRAISM